MLNKEKYAKEIIEVLVENNGGAIGLKNGKPADCQTIACSDCDYNHRRGCDGAFREWANSEYVEPTVDWSKVAVDTPILVRDEEEQEWGKRHFAKYQNGKVYAWYNGVTSWSAEDDDCIVEWIYAKLAESEGD